MEELFQEIRELIESPGLIGIALVAMGTDDVFSRWSGGSNPLTMLGAVETLKHSLVNSMYEH